MAQLSIHHLLSQLAFYALAIFSWFLYLFLCLRSGLFFQKPTEQDTLQQAIARDKFWNLSKSPLSDFFHRFYTLRSGRKLHYITNYEESRAKEFARANLAIFLHGYPDSSMMWRYLLGPQKDTDLTKAILVCVDLPGFGGSDSFPYHGADEVLDAVTEFIIAMRETYLEIENEAIQPEERNTYIVGHDWGCIIGMRLASEASCLADRYILMNAPHPELAKANKNRIMDSAAMIFRQFKQHPFRHRACLAKTLRILQPFLYQALLFGYIAVFHLPSFMVKYLCTGGNLSFAKGTLRSAFGGNRDEYNEQDALSSTFGPGIAECSTLTSNQEGYGKTVSTRAGSPGEVVMNMTSYYRDGLAFGHWHKSLEIITDLHSIEVNNAKGSPARRRSSSASSALFGDHHKGALHAPTTILWGQKDQACTQVICLDGIGDYLPRDSEVVLFPRTGHWFPIEKESRRVLAGVLDHYVCKDHVVGNVGELCQQLYPDARVMVKK